MAVEVRCFGERPPDAVEHGVAVRGYAPWGRLSAGADGPRFVPALETLSIAVAMARDPVDADVAHAHTWYADMAGLWIRTLYRIPLIVTLHSMEPLRPWKADQLGTGYLLSSWIEKTAVEAADRVIAVSRQMREVILAHFSVDPEKVVVIHNGIDPERFRRTEHRDASHEQDVGRPHAEPVERVPVLGAPKALGVDPVVDDDPLLGVHAEVGGDALPHLPGDRDHAVGGLDRRLLDPARQEIARAELVGLPGPERLHAVERDDQRDPVERSDPEPRHVGVPGVGVGDVGVHGIARHRERDRKRLERRGEAGPVGTRAQASPRCVAADRDAVLARVGRPLAEAADLHRHAPAQGARQLVHDDARAAVDVRGVLAREDERLHASRIRSGRVAGSALPTFLLALELARDGARVDAEQLRRLGLVPPGDPESLVEQPLLDLGERRAD